MVNNFTFFQNRLTGWLMLFLMTLLLSGSQEAAAQCGFAAGLGCPNTDYNNFGYNSTDNAATIEYDNYVSAFHSTVVRTYDGTFMIWGEQTGANGSKNLLSPTAITPGSGEFAAMTGTPVKATMGSQRENTVQTFVITAGDQDYIWVWGNASNAVVTSGNNGWATATGSSLAL